MTPTEPASDEKLLRMGELAEVSGVSAATIKHYLREGLLPEPVKTSRNMAWYPVEFAGRIKLIKQLQEERFMPLKVIRELLEKDPDRARRMVELGSTLLERARAGEADRVPVAEAIERYEVPAEALERLAELGVLTPDEAGYSPADLQVVEAISRFRRSGYDERIGFTVYDTLRYKKAIAELVREEIDVLTDRLAGEMDTDRVLEMVDQGVAPLNDLMAALRIKELVAELERRLGESDDAQPSPTA